MLEEFKKYVSNYDLNNPKIRLRYNHCLRVMKLNRKYAIALGFSKEDIELASLIGLLHDIGRFEQVRIYGSFNDLETIDHADYSVEQLFDRGLIKTFWADNSDYEIIKFAIKNHNKYNIPKCNNERMLMHAKLIRDTDKMDIFHFLGVLDEMHERASSDIISSEVKKQIFNHQLGSRKYSRNNNDNIAINYSFVFDINYDICIPEIKNNFEAYYELVGREDIFKEIIDVIENYLIERIDNSVRN